MSENGGMAVLSRELTLCKSLPGWLACPPGSLPEAQWGEKPALVSPYISQDTSLVTMLDEMRLGGSAQRAHAGPGLPVTHAQESPLKVAVDSVQNDRRQS